MKHVEDDAIVRFLDDQCEAGEQEKLRKHLATCAECQARMQELRERIGIVTGALRATDLARPANRRPLHWRKWGMVAAMALFAIGAIVPPVRAWVVEQTRGLWHLVAPEPRATIAEADSANADVPESASISFAPGLDVFVLEFATRQTRGSISIRLTDSPTATALVVGDPDAQNLIVMPSGLRVINHTESTASYEIGLPQTLGRIRVTLADERPLELDPAGARQRWEIDLTVR